MSGFLGFGPLNTPIGKIIAKATEDGASAGDLNLHLQICDYVNQTEEGPKDAIAAIKKRLSSAGKNNHILNLTLCVLETCVKNCGERFHTRIAQKDFLNELSKIVNSKSNVSSLIKERILGLIQTWADAFRGKPELIAVVELYDQLKEEGKEFPPVDLDAMAPINTPERRSTPTIAPSQEGSSPSTGGQPHRAVSEGALAKVFSEVDMVRTNMAVLNEMMAAIDPGMQTAGEGALMNELSIIIKEMQKKVAVACGRTGDDTLLATLLALNDEVNGVVVRYERYCKNQSKEGNMEAATAEPISSSSQQTTETTLDDSRTVPKEPPPSYGDLTSADMPLIDLGEEITQPPQPTPQIDQLEKDLAGMGVQQVPMVQPMVQPIPPPVQPSGVTTVGGVTTGASPTDGVDEFDMFAQSRQMAYNTSSGTSYADQKGDATQSLSAAIQKNPASTEEESVKALEDWLSFGNEKPSSNQPATTGPPSGPEVATSAEFEQFLAQRSQDVQQRPRPQMQKQEEDDGLFAL